MSDVLVIHQLQAQAIVGVHPHERLHPQPLRFDIEFVLDTAAAANSDDLRDALDYQAVCDQLLQRLERLRFELLEALAADLADWLFARFQCARLRLTVYKPNAVARAQWISLAVQRPPVPLQ